MLMTKFKNVMNMIEFPTRVDFVSPLGTKSVKQKRWYTVNTVRISFKFIRIYSLRST